ncbi:sucrase ferredoxin [Cronbergia sp. UHCC 0137]|uniref:sucrase ferredoxin n=1 Tax=Cronbergia sp. UHCC 0137 TaxID=3110239 RepID=UPI002B20876D|nr:sucrase ferredoxin [Cronbergia sp. UHCC 0137]MEA5617132.1 sucrase ferredoxin [Cronbergia sp. UHCC 0137]
MNHFFCADESRQVNEDPIGSGCRRQCYVLIECPPPWMTHEFDSKAVPENLRSLEAEFYEVEPDGILLFIYSEELRQNYLTRILIFRPMMGYSGGYTKQEIHVSSLEDVANVLKDWLAGKDIGGTDINPHTRDILVCTHGTHDKCCAKYGIPFYRQAKKIVADLAVESVRIWQSSHFSGHRFAPTILDLSQGRYYGKLDSQSLTNILTYTGDIHCLKSIYRGWGILPFPAQVMERELIFRHGWQWFNYKVSCCFIEQSEDECFNYIEISTMLPNGDIKTYQADVVEDESKSLYLIGDCNGTEAERISKYTVSNLIRVK